MCSMRTTIFAHLNTIYDSFLEEDRDQDQIPKYKDEEYSVDKNQIRDYLKELQKNLSLSDHSIKLWLQENILANKKLIDYIRRQNDADAISALKLLSGFFDEVKSIDDSFILESKDEKVICKVETASFPCLSRHTSFAPVILSDSYLVLVDDGRHCPLTQKRIDSLIKIWDTKNRTMASTLLWEGEKLPTVKPIGDGLHICIEGSEVWDLSNPYRPVQSSLTLPFRPYEDFHRPNSVSAMLPDNKHVLRFTEKNKLGLWDLSSSETTPLHVFIPPLENSYFKSTNILLLEDGEHFIAGAIPAEPWPTAQKFYLWNINQPAKPVDTFEPVFAGYGDPFTLVLLPNKEQFLAYGGEKNHVVYLYDIPTKKRLAEFIGPCSNDNNITTVIPLPDNQHFIVHYKHHGIWLWDIRNPEVPHTKLIEDNSGSDHSYLESDGRWSLMRWRADTKSCDITTYELDCVKKWLADIKNKFVSSNVTTLLRPLQYLSLDYIPLAELHKLSIFKPAEQKSMMSDKAKVTCSNSP